jgi:hypothetical protein
MAVRFDPCPESRQLGISMIVMVLLIKLCGLFDVKPFYMSAGKKNTSNQIFGDVFTNVCSSISHSFFGILSTGLVSDNSVCEYSSVALHT